MIYPLLPRLYNDHVGTKNNFVSTFHYSDSKEMFLRNRATQPSDWKYRNSPNYLKYEFDDHGFRNNSSLTEITTRPYIATVGCSHTMGTGLFYEETYSYHLENLTALPVYNMGLAASSNEISALNITWLLNNYAPPSAVVFQKASELRFPVVYTEDPSDGQLFFVGPWVRKYSSYYHDLEQMLITADKHGYTVLKDTMSEMIIRQQCDRLGINLIVLDINEELKSYTKDLDFSRDLAHYGNDVHLHIATSLSQKI